jgi:hypothetical protein
MVKESFISKAGFGFAQVAGAVPVVGPPGSELVKVISASWFSLHSPEREVILDTMAQKTKIAVIVAP